MNKLSFHTMMKGLNRWAFLLLAFFPIVKYGLSSTLLITFCLSAIILNYKGFVSRIQKTPITHILAHGGFYIVLVISLLYSDNFEEGLDSVSKSSLLFFVPFVLIYFNPKFEQKTISLFLSLFLLSNIIFIYFLFDYLISGLSMQYMQALDQQGLLTQIKSLYDLNFNNALWHSEQLLETTFLFHKPYFSMNFILCFVVAIDRIVSQKQRKVFIGLYLLIAILFLVTTFYALSIPNLAAMGACLIIIPFVYYSKLNRIALIWLSSGIAVSFVVIFYFILIKESQNKDLARGVNFIKTILTNEEAEYNDPRMEIYKSTIPIITANPILGVGVGDIQDVLMASYLSRTNHNDQKGRPNLLTHSERLDENSWYKSNINVVKNIANAPDGRMTADVIIDDTADGGHSILQTLDITSDSMQYSFSVYAKFVNTDYLILRMGDITTQRASFNISNGTLGYKGPLLTNAEIEDVGDGWYRCAISTEISDELTALIGMANAATGYNYAGDANNTSHICGANVEAGSSATSYRKGKNELLTYAIDEDLNTHNNYLHFYISGGVFCLLLFIWNFVSLSKRAFSEKSYLMISFCVILILNLLSENTLSRHFGLMFYSVFLIVFLNKYFPQESVIRDECKSS